MSNLRFRMEYCDEETTEVLVTVYEAKYSDWSKRCDTAIHLLDPNPIEIDSAIDDALGKGFNKVICYNIPDEAQVFDFMAAQSDKRAYGELKGNYEINKR